MNQFSIKQAVVCDKMFEVWTEFWLKMIGIYPSPYLLRIQIIQVSIGICALGYNNYLYYSTHLSAFKITIFFIADVVQEEAIIMIQIYFYYRIHQLSSKKFYKEVFKYFKWRLNENSQKRLKIQMGFIVLTRIARFTLYFPNYFLYTFAVASAELVLSTSDFIIVLILENLIENQNLLKLQMSNGVNLKNFDKKIYQMIRIERKIIKRFSHELFITISYNYFMLIVCLYWSFIRITRGKLSNRHGKFN